MSSPRPRTRFVLPALFTALAVGGAGLSASPAYAADEPHQPGKRQTLTVPSSAEIAAQAKKFLKQEAGSAGDRKADGARSAAPAPAGEQPSATASPSPSGSSTTADPKVIGGVDAPFGEAPWMTQLYGFDPATGDNFFCGGVLIGPAKVLTAAHCVAGVDWTQQGIAVAGATQAASDGVGGEPNWHGGTPALVKRQWVHPSYDGDIRNDIAVLTLDRPMPHKPLRTVTPNDTASYAAGTTATVYGWGRTSGAPGSEGSQTLKRADLPIQADSACTSFPAGAANFVPGEMFCAGEPAGGTDATTVSPCNGDSGGPLIVGGRIAGIVSWGVEDCIEAGAYSMYAKVSTFAGAIGQQADDANFTDDNKADIVAVRKDNAEGYTYASQGTSLGAAEFSGFWDGVDLVRQADLNADANQDFVFRAGGDLYWSRWQWDAGTEVYDWVETRIGSGWSGFRAILVPGDVSGDGWSDLVTVDSAGALWVYPGRGDGTFMSRIQGGSGWTGYTIAGHGDYTSDGVPDVLARDAQGRMWLYVGRGVANAPLSNQRVQIGTGWNFTAYVGPGDVTGDGASDMVVRDSDGKLYLYPSRNSPTQPFRSRHTIGSSGWNAFAIIT
ncbi:trypsin-like serine protease [Streptomyces sp. CC228A]|uniref:trypsin-like serine protease n=1 Tax=Streptomyces sp. CC228A TaxID=2898186 RepID=UPI001F3B8BC1|nr:trypsin-like serine protease [Streptomyces sp. CC228A]